MLSGVKIWAYAASTAMVLCTSTIAAAQSSDVVVMRKMIDGRLDGELLPPSIRPAPAQPKPGDANYYSWQVTAWKQVGSCGSRGTETRTVQCVRTDGNVGPDASCTGNGSGTKPIASRPANMTQTCGYGWQTSDWSVPAPTCGTTRRTRDVVCMRSDGSPAEADSCPAGSRPDASESYTDTSTCSYGWSTGAWSEPSTQCGPATLSRAVACVRSDGRASPADRCDAAARPATTQDVEIEVGCANHWTIGEWGSPAAACGSTFSYRSVTCVRSDGVPVSDDQCVTTKPIGREAAIDYSTCTDGRSNDHPYGWSIGEYGAPSTTCGQAVATRSIRCTGNDGREVSADRCVTPRPEASRASYETSGCTVRWATGEYWDPQPACGATASLRSVSCMRSDGQSVSTYSCPADERPTSSRPTTDYSACSFGWTATSWSDWDATCGPATQTREVSCQRSDGSAAIDGSCDAKTRPATSQSSYQTSGCGIAWKAGAWETALPACGASTQSRQVVCMRSDGQEIDAGECSRLARPSDTRDVTDYSTCSYAWVTGAFQGATTTCGTTTRSRSVLCQRSDSAIVDDESCASAGDRPATSETTTQTSGCTFDWDTGDWGRAAAACGPSVHSRTVTCRRSDGTAADPSQCVKTKPSTSEAVADYSTCTYDWKVDQWDGSGGCGDTVTQRRSVSCIRSEGSTVADGYCGSLKPAPSQTITDYSACTYSWKVVPGLWSSTCSASATRTNSVTCLRQDNQEVDDSFCSTTKPETVNTGNYSSCTYTPSYGEYQTCMANSNGGTAGTQTATITSCRRSDGVIVDTGACKPASLSKSCTITYTPTYADTYTTCTANSAGSTAGTQSSNITSCTRSSDGASVPNSYCSAATTSRSCTITYTPTYSTVYGVCTPNSTGSTVGTETAPITTCTRSTDNASVSTTYCSPQTKSRSCTPTVGSLSCGSTMGAGTPWGVDGDGYNRVGSATGSTTAARMADALAKCATYANNTRKVAGVCGFNDNSGYSIYYWNSTNVRTVGTTNFGTICK